MIDLKSTGMAWVGNLKQKVEAVYQEVDNIMSQDSVKFVGNQVQTVGKSMKRLYSGIAHDRPSVVGPVRHQPERAAVSMNADVSTSVDLKVGVQGSLRDADDKLLHKVPVSAPLMTKDSDYPVKINHFEVTPESRTYVNLIHGEWSNLVRGENETVLTGELLDDENLNEKKAPSSSTVSKSTTLDEKECSVSRFNTVDSEQWFGRLLGNQSTGADDKHRILNLEKTLAEQSVSDGIRGQEKMKVSKTFMDIESPSDDSRIPSHSEPNSLASSCAERMTAEVLGSPAFYGNFPPEQKLTGQTRTFDLNHVSSDSVAYTPTEPTSTLTCEENIKGEGIEPSGYVCEGAFLYGQNIGTMSNNFTDESLCPASFTSSFNQFNEAFPTAHHDDETVEKKVDLSSLSLLEGHQAFVDSQKEQSAKECQPIVDPGFVSDDAFTIHTPTGLPSTENIVHESLVSKNPHKESLAEEHKPADMPLSGPSTDSADDLSVSSMETIELSEKEKLESGCVVLDNTALYAVSSTWRKLSYKKMIQNAFTSKKRLAKEYEQLGIQFGDADIWQDQDSSETLLPSAASGCENIKAEVTHDSEWEII